MSSSSKKDSQEEFFKNTEPLESTSNAMSDIVDETERSTIRVNESNDEAIAAVDCQEHRNSYPYGQEPEKRNRKSFQEALKFWQDR